MPVPHKTNWDRIGCTCGHGPKSIGSCPWCVRLRELRRYSKCLEPVSREDRFDPCGRCAECVKDYKKHWIGRLAAEMFMSDGSYFFTGTYDDEHYKHGCEREHFKYFLRLLKKHPSVKGVKHKTVHEHGDERGRGHWHSILMLRGQIPDCLVLDFTTKQPFWIYGTSRWERPRSLAGTASYIMDYLDKGGTALRPSPGIGKQYLLNFARSQARNRLNLVKGHSIPYTVPGQRPKNLTPKEMKKRAGAVLTPERSLWTYKIRLGHPYAEQMIHEYLAEWYNTHTDFPNERQFEYFGGDIYLNDIIG